MTTSADVMSGLGPIRGRDWAEGAELAALIGRATKACLTTGWVTHSHTAYNWTEGQFRETKKYYALSTRSVRFTFQMTKRWRKRAMHFLSLVI